MISAGIEVCLENGRRSQTQEYWGDYVAINKDNNLEGRDGQQAKYYKGYTEGSKHMEIWWTK